MSKLSGFLTSFSHGFTYFFHFFHSIPTTGKREGLYLNVHVHVHLIIICINKSSSVMKFNLVLEKHVKVVWFFDKKWSNVNQS